MGFVTKTWKDPVNINSNNLNRIEQGIKNSHDTLEILEEEVSNLQTKQLDILEQLKTSTPNISSDTILEQLNSILGDTEILTALKNADSFLTKSAQELTKAELNQVYKNLDLDRMLKLTDIRVNDTSVVQGSIASITLPKVDKILNLNSNNAISNSAVVRAINKLIKDIESNTTFYLKDAIEDDEHMTVSRDEIVKWNSIDVDLFLTEESDPTVPAWAKASTKPIYTYNEIVGTPTIPTDNTELENGRGYITSSEASTIASNLLNTFQTNTINPLSSRVTNLEAMDVTITNALNNKADANHTHSNLASITWVTKEIEDKIAELVGSAPATLDTIQELAAALSNNADIIDIINNNIANKTTVAFGNTVQPTVTFDSDPQTQIDNIVNNTTKIRNSSGGFNAGNNSVAYQGGAIGKNASSLHGGSIGDTAITDEGGAVGYQAISANGGAIGQGTQTSNGFAGGYNAKTINGGLTIDAIQLGTGTNTQTKTLQVYDDNIYDANTHNLSLLGSFSALNNIGGGFSISDPVNVGIELGRKDGTSGTPYIDFHTDGNPNTDYNVRLLATGSELRITAGSGVSINGSKLGHSATLLYSIDKKKVAYTLAQPIENFSYILIVNRRAGQYRMPTLIPVGYILSHQNVEFLMESWDGSRFRIIFTNTTAKVSAEYYALPCEVWGIK